jgi:hypothetical protein
LTIQRELQVRCPVTALITGMESERGFRELVRRVGRTRSANQRFGRRFELRTTPTASEIQAFTGHVCGAFEDWVYTLFREAQALTRPGNIRLYGLLCKVRCTLKTRLAETLSGSYGYDKEQTPFDAPLLFSGCYFAATGKTPDRQAFVKALFDKLSEEQEDLEWTDLALTNFAHRRRLFLVGWGLAGILGISLATMVIYDLING